MSVLIEVIAISIIIINRVIAILPVVVGITHIAEIFFNLFFLYLINPLLRLLLVILCHFILFIHLFIIPI